LKETKLLPKAEQARLGNYLKPSHETIRIEGKMCYHEGSQGWTKIIFKKDILELCKELQDKQSEFGYELEYPASEEAKREFLEWLSKNMESWPFFLRLKKIEGYGSSKK